jgi:hypothetical protein
MLRKSAANERQQPTCDRSNDKHRAKGEVNVLSHQPSNSLSLPDRWKLHRATPLEPFDHGGDRDAEQFTMPFVEARVFIARQKGHLHKLGAMQFAGMQVRAADHLRRKGC